MLLERWVCAIAAWRWVFSEKWTSKGVCEDFEVVEGVGSCQYNRRKMTGNFVCWNESSPTLLHEGKRVVNGMSWTSLSKVKMWKIWEWGASPSAIANTVSIIWTLAQLAHRAALEILANAYGKLESYQPATAYHLTIHPIVLILTSYSVIILRLIRNVYFRRSGWSRKRTEGG